MFDGLLGNASQVEINQVQSEIGPLLIEGEKPLKAYKLIRDLFVFTNLRLILVDKQGLSGKKVEYQCIPYKSITHFAVETAGTFDRDSEIKIWISGGHFVEKEVKKSINVLEIQKLLATFILSKN